jgi:hypothetical protein
MRLLTKATVVVAVLSASSAFAQFAPGPNPVTGAETAGRTLAGGTGTVTGTGSITTTGTTIGVLMSGGTPGTPTVLDNAGIIQQTGTVRAIDNAANNSSLMILNSGRISSISTDAIRINTANTSVSLINSGTINVSNGGQAIDWAAITTATNALTNQSSGRITAVGEDAVRPGQNGTVINAGLIEATPTFDTATTVTGSDGIDLRTQKTVSVTNSGTISGRHGIATDGANIGPSSLTVTNNAGGVIQAVNGSGINVDANIVTNPIQALAAVANVTNAFGATIKGGALAGTAEADGDGIDVDGVLTLTNSGDVLGLGARGGSNNAEGVAAGGGSITNTATGRIIGSTLAADAPNGDPTRAGNGILIDDSNGGNAVAATTVINDGRIEGKSGFGIKLVGNFNDSITNRGTIIGGSGLAADLGGGDDSLRVEGGTASIVGNVSGGAGTNSMVVDPGTGNSFTYSGVVSNFSLFELRSGTATLSGANTYTGITRVSNAELVLDGVGRIQTVSALDLSGGTLRLANTGGVANAQTFASLSLNGASTIDLGNSSLTFEGLGGIAPGSLTLVNWSDTTSPAFAFRVLGDQSGSAAFLQLLGGTTINGLTAGYYLSGGYTNVTPTPLPAGVVLLASGLALFGGLARRRSASAEAAARA